MKTCVASDDAGLLCLRLTTTLFRLTLPSLHPFESKDCVSSDDSRYESEDLRFV